MGVGGGQYPGEKEITFPPFTCLESHGDPRVEQTKEGELIIFPLKEPPPLLNLIYPALLLHSNGKSSFIQTEKLAEREGTLCASWNRPGSKQDLGYRSGARCTQTNN